MNASTVLRAGEAGMWGKAEGMLLAQIEETSEPVLYSQLGALYRQMGELEKAGEHGERAGGKAERKEERRQEEVKKSN